LKGLEVAVDSFFYRKLVIVPWNIVAYNVFGGREKGPEIFGTESWTFYIRNLLLNFNAWFVLALSAAPLLVLQATFGSHTSKQTLLRSVTFLTPFYMWLAIFTCQPHKEERFMFPAYPFLALNAAIALHILLSYIGSSNAREMMGRIPPKLKFMVSIGSVFLIINLGLLRTIGMITAYNAPFLSLQSLEKVDTGNAGDSVCFGKEWYRFPSSFFLPNGMRAKFVRSEFRGLLPGEFTETEANRAPFAGTWVIPSGMNDRNQEDPRKYVGAQTREHVTIESTKLIC
jgi:alpha-1,2-mannosyltransferase